jgi:tol-pal system-associated acyl-CoA thioesterase
MSSHHVHPVQIYYEDTDHSGVVYHSNYLKYFERAREHIFGVDELIRLHVEEGIGFVVYKAELTFKAGAVFGDTVEVLTRVEKESAYRLLFHQDVHRPRDQAVLVEGLVHLVCVDAEKKLVPLPASVLARLQG